MLKRYFYLLRQDIKVTFRNYFHIVILALVTLMILFINFAIPNEMKLTPTELIVDNTEEKLMEKYLLQHGASKERIFSSKEELLQKIEEDDNALGIVIEGNIEKPKVTVIHQGTESTEILNLLDVTIEKAFDEIRGTHRATNHRIEYLRTKTEAIAFNKNMVPIMLMTEAVMLGFLLIAVMVFQEKEEGSIRVYRISPGKTLEYILSKATINILLAVVYSIILVVFTIGLNVNYVALIILITLSSFFVTVLGLTISVFFKNLQEFLFIGVLFIALLGLPMATYLSPSFAPEFLTWIPSYSMLFGIREILFPTGKSEFLLSLNITLVIESLIFLILSYLAVNKKLMKEGK